MVDSTAVRKKKGGYSRSADGCRTCRIRRVKCDELKPDCRKCSSTGRECEWFSVTSDKQSAASKAIKASRQDLVIHESPSQFPGAKARELRGFEFFLKRTAPEMSYFDGDLWPGLVLQLTRYSQPVLHAAIALGTMHEIEEINGMIISRHRLPDDRHQFAVSQYNSALTLLANPTTAISPRHQALVLASCLIFIHIEILRGEYFTALKHVSGGLKILNNQTSSTLDSSEVTILESALKRLDLLLGHFSGEPFTQSASSLDKNFNDLELLRPLIAKGSIARLVEVKEHCEMLEGLTSKLLDHSRNFLRGECCSAHAAHFGAACNYFELSRPYCETIQTSHAELAQTQKRLVDYIFEYQGELDNLSRSEDIRQNHKRRFSALLLKIHLLAMLMQVRACLADDVELAYDAFDDEMLELLAAANMFSHRPSCKLWYEMRPTLLTDWGIIPPVFHVALKCREPLVRRQALELLEVWPHREGFWDSALVVAVAKKIVEIEENGASIEHIQQNRSSLARTSSIFTLFSNDQSKIMINYDHWVGPDIKQRKSVLVPI